MVDTTQTGPLARPIQQEGGANYDIMIVRGGNEPEPYWDTVTTIAQAWKRANPNDRRSITQIGQWIIEENHLKTKDGKDCKGDLDVAVIWAGQRLKLPEGAALGDFDVVYARNCNPPKTQPEILMFTTPRPAPMEEIIPAVAPVRAKAPYFPTTNTLGNGQDSEQQNLMNAILQVGIWPEQPDPAARGIARNPTGIQTVVASSAEVGAYAATTLATIPVGPGIGINLFPGFMTGLPNSQARGGDERQGSNAPGGTRFNNLEVAGRTGYRDGLPFNIKALWLSPSDATRRAATLVPLVGVRYNQDGETRDDSTTMFHNDQYYPVVGEGAYAPSSTQSEREVTTGQPNRFLQGQPSGPIESSMTNYEAAYLFNEVSIQPQINAMSAAFYESPTPEEGRKLVELLNYQSTLVGISNYPVDPEKINRPLTQQEIARLNPREQVLYLRESAVRFAREKGITLDPLAMPVDCPVRAEPQDVARAKAIAYFEELATKKPGIFKDIYRDEMDGESANWRNPQQRREMVERFVDNLPAMKNWPSNQPLNYLDSFISTRDQTAPLDLSRDNFNDVENFQLLPKGRPTGPAAMRDAMSLLGGSESSTALLLAGSGNRRIADAFFAHDDTYIERPREFGARIQFDRAERVDDIRDRGYRDSLFGTTFSREETNAKNRNPGDVSADLVASAANPDVVRRRMGDLRAMATAGGSQYLSEGGLGMQMLYALAIEPNNTTLKAIIADIRAKAPSPEIADQQVETLLQGVEYAKEHVSSVMFNGPSLNDVATYTYARDLDDLSARTGAGPEAETSTRTRTVVEPENVRQLFGSLSRNPAAAQAFAAAVGGQSAENNALFIGAAAKLSPAEQLTLARTALGSNAAAAIAMVNSSGLPAEAKAKFAADAAALTEANAKDVLATIAQVPTLATAATRAIAANGPASALAMKGLSEDATAASTLSGALSAAQKTDILGKTNIDLTATPDPFGAVAPQTVLDPVTRRRAAAAPLPSVIDGGRFESAMALADQRARDIAYTTAFFTTPSTQTTALQSLVSNHPDYATALIVQTLSDNPNLVGPALSSLRRMGDQRTKGLANANDVFDTHPQGNLAMIVARLVDAQERGDQRAVAQATQQLNRFMASTKPADRQAVTDLITATIGAKPREGINGRDAVVTSIESVMARAASGTENPLPSYAFPTTPDDNRTAADKTIGIFYNSVTQADVGNVAAGAEESVAVWRNSTTRSGLIIPIVPVFWRDTPKSNPNTTPGLPPGCCPEPRPLVPGIG